VLALVTDLKKNKVNFTVRREELTMFCQNSTVHKIVQIFQQLAGLNIITRTPNMNKWKEPF